MSTCSYCGSRICALAVKNGANIWGGAATFIVTPNGTIPLGLERAGNYKDLYNVGCGGNENNPNNQNNRNNRYECCLLTAGRETDEELKVELTNLITTTCDSVIVHHSTAVFIVHCNVDVAQMDQRVRNAVNSNLQWKYKEMSRVKEFSLSSNSAEISSFTLALMRKYNTGDFYKLPTLTPPPIVQSFSSQSFALPPVKKDVCSHVHCHMCRSKSVGKIRVVLHNTSYVLAFPNGKGEFGLPVTNVIATECLIETCKRLMKKFNMPLTSNFKTKIIEMNGVKVSVFAWSCETSNVSDIGDLCESVGNGCAWFHVSTCDLVDNSSVYRLSNVSKEIVKLTL